MSNNTIIMNRVVGDKFLLEIDGVVLVDLLIVSIQGKKVELAFRLPPNVKISTIKKLLTPKK